MRTREQVTVTGDFPATTEIDRLLGELAPRAIAECERRGLSLTDWREKENMNYGVIWLRNNGAAENPDLGECMPAEADVTRVTLNVWGERA